MGSFGIAWTRLACSKSGPYFLTGYQVVKKATSGHASGAALWKPKVMLFGLSGRSPALDPEAGLKEVTLGNGVD